MNTSVNIAGVTLKNPVVTASGTFGNGWENGQYFDLSELGAVCVKAITLKPKAGNESPRIAGRSPPEFFKQRRTSKSRYRALYAVRYTVS